MSTGSTTNSLEHPFCNVNSPINTQLPLFSDSMIHHNTLVYSKLKIPIIYKGERGRGYGVSSSHRVLSPGLLLKKYDYVKDCLRVVLGLTPAQSEVVLRLLRFDAYYGEVFPKAATLAGEYELTPAQVSWRASESLGSPPRRGEIGRATVWRTIHLLKERGLLSVVNRYLIRPHAQISNLYRLDKLLIVIARYLCEHIAHLWDDWLWPYLHQPWPQFWSSILGLSQAQPQPPLSERPF